MSEGGFAWVTHHLGCGRRRSLCRDGRCSSAQRGIR
jgi:hypothetical protein